jgi:hypothetical protein
LGFLVTKKEKALLLRRGLAVDVGIAVAEVSKRLGNLSGPAC